MRRIIAPLILILGLLLAGCGSGSPHSGDAGAPEPDSVRDGAQSSSVQDSDSAGSAGADGDREIIATGDMRVITDSPSTTAEEIAKQSESRGGHVESREDWEGAQGETVVDLTLRIPADELDALMTDVEGSGELVQRSQSAEDVTGAVRDLDARIKALEVSIDRLEEIMGEADSTGDLLEAEKALSERQGELESLVAQRDDLDDQVSMSTLQVELRTTESASGSGGFGDWFRDLGMTLVYSAGGLVTVLVALLPWAIALGIPAWLLTRWFLRWRRASKRSRASEQSRDSETV